MRKHVVAVWNAHAKHANAKEDANIVTIAESVPIVNFAKYGIATWKKMWDVATKTTADETHIITDITPNGTIDTEVAVGIDAIKEYLTK